MDIKVHGLNREILAKALDQAVAGYNFILDKMDAAIAQPRPELSPYAPRILVMKVPVDKIRDVIGPGGKMVNKIIDETGVKIDIEADGTIYIASPDGEASAKPSPSSMTWSRKWKLAKSTWCRGRVELRRLRRTVAGQGRSGSHFPIGPQAGGQDRGCGQSRRQDRSQVIDIDEKGRVKLSHKVLLPRSLKKQAPKRPQIKRQH